MAKYNETTAKVLDILSEGEATAASLAKDLGCSYANVETILLKLVRSGRASRIQQDAGEVVIRENPRVTRPARRYAYAVTEKGRQRLATIRSSVGKPKGESS